MTVQNQITNNGYSITPGYSVAQDAAKSVEALKGEHQEQGLDIKQDIGIISV
jgi:hypothetical protein